MRAISSSTASTSGRASGVARTWTCQPGWTPTDRPTRRRAYSSIRRSRTRPSSTVSNRRTQLSFSDLLERAEEVFDLERRQRLDLRRAPRPQRDRDLRDGRDVRCLDDVDEVELAERRPLVQDAAAELLDVLVHLAKPLRVRLERRDALLRERREQDEQRHALSLLRARPGRGRGARRPGRAAG